MVMKMNNKTKQVIYNMLTENTGKHFLDSGGASGRHWQRNELKTIDDFEKENDIEVIDQDTDDPYIYKSLYHHLVDSCTYLEKDTNDLINWINKDPYHWADNKDGRCNSLYDVEEYMRLTYDRDTRIEYTYNDEYCSLSQDIQFISLGDTYDCNIIALAIHNGADARGGFTDYKIFEIEEDLFYTWWDNYQDYKENSWLSL